MAREKKSFDQGGGNEWMNTYADLVTLLLCFFVLLFTMSSVEEEKWEALVRSFRRLYGSEVVIEDPNANVDPGDIIIDPEDLGLPDDFGELAEYFQQVVEENNFAGDVQITGNDYVVFIQFNNNLLFDPNSSNLRPAAKDFLNIIGDSINHMTQKIKMIRINGHTAAATITSGENVNDRELSSERANSVLMYLEDIKHVEPQKLIAIGYGRNYPIADNSSEEGRTKNRRVEIIIMAENTPTEGGQSVFDILSGNFDLSIYQSLADKIAEEQEIFPKNE